MLNQEVSVVKFRINHSCRNIFYWIVKIKFSLFFCKVSFFFYDLDIALNNCHLH